MKQLVIAVTAALFSLSVHAAGRPSDQPTGQPDSATASSNADQPGPRMGRHHRMWRSGARHNPGWDMLTPEERKQHMQKMRSLKNVDECKAYIDEHHKLIESRAKEKNQPMPHMKGDPCQRMEKHGMFAK